jgi:hypothetical protein
VAVVGYQVELVKQQRMRGGEVADQEVGVGREERVAICAGSAVGGAEAGAE